MRLNIIIKANGSWARQSSSVTAYVAKSKSISFSIVNEILVQPKERLV